MGDLLAEKGKGIFRNELPRRRCPDGEGKKDFSERTNGNGHFAISSEEWMQSRQMTLDARKGTKHGEGPKNVFVVFAPVPVVVANPSFLICFL